MIKFDYPEGATPLDPDETEGLIPEHIHVQSDLNEWEQSNILQAESWIVSRHFTQQQILTIDFIKSLHKKMFDNTWKWAGKFRQTDKNIGVDWRYISEKLKLLIDDVGYQLKENSFQIDEIATRFHHRLVLIHPFSNGNGRHARLMTDLLLSINKQPRFSWGKNTYRSTTHLRQAYIHALRAADKQDYAELLCFVRA